MRLIGSKWLQLVLSMALLGCENAHEAVEIDLSKTIDPQTINQRIHPENTIRKTFYFGFDLRASPQEDSRQYLPFLKYLEQQTDYHFEMRFTPKGSSVGEELGKGKIDFAAMGASSYLQAREKYNAKIIARGINHLGKAEYQSMIVVAPDSKIRSVHQLKGKRLAFGSKTSTQGHLIPRIILNDYKIKLEDLLNYTYTGSHQNCATAVMAGKADACGMQDTMARDMARKGHLKIIHTSRYYPSSGIVARAALDEQVVQVVKRALVGFAPQGKHRQGLYHWDRTEMPKGFVNAQKADYKELYKWSVRLGMIQTADVQEAAIQ